MLRGLGGWSPILPKPRPNKRMLNVNTQKPAVRGRSLANQPGSQVRSIPKRFSLCLLGYRTPLFEHGSGCLAGMQGASAGATAHIHGIGKFWRNSLVVLPNCNSKSVAVASEVHCCIGACLLLRWKVCSGPRG